MIVNTNKYSTTDAVKEVLEEMTTGSELVGYQLYNKVLKKMNQHNTGKRPLDSTVLRLVREYGDLYGVKAKSAGVSVYIKDRLF